MVWLRIACGVLLFMASGLSAQVAPLEELERRTRERGEMERAAPLHFQAEVAELAGEEPAASIDARVLRGLAGLALYAYHAEPSGRLLSVELWPAPDARLIYHAELQRFTWERDVRLGPLHVHVALAHDAGSVHVEGSVLFLNSESRTPVGEVRSSWLGVGAVHGSSVFAARYAVPYGIAPAWLPDGSASTWQLAATRAVRAGDFVPLAFVASWGGWEYANRLAIEPDHVRRRGALLIPSPDLSARRIAALEEEAARAWAAFQVDTRARQDPSYLFGESRAIGSAGDQAHLGKHPALAVLHPSVASPVAADHLRGVLLWAEGRRSCWFDWPLRPHHEPGSAYHFDGLHFTSRWTAGFRWRDGGWSPAHGSSHGVSGYNLEHFRSRLPELALATGDPALLWLTSRLGAVLFETLGTVGIGGGGYYGGGWSTLRGWLRPLAELMEVCVVLEVAGGELYAERAARLRAHVEHKLEDLLRQNPGLAKVPDRPDEQIPGHFGEPVVESWQAGLGGDFCYSWHLRTGSAAALELATRLQRVQVASWRGGSFEELQMAKHVLASDYAVGLGYDRRHDALTTWNRSLLDIPGLAGVDQSRRRLAVQVIDAEFPEAHAGKWGNGPWTGFQPAKLEPRRPWFIPAR